MRTNVCYVPRYRIVVIGVLLAAIIGVIVPQQAYANQVLCSGNSYSTCINAGYTAHGFEHHFTNSHWGAYSGHNCTNYAAYTQIKLGATAPPGLMGNAAEWARNAKSYGYSVGQSPRVGAIAQWDAYSGSAGPAGHVAYVERVSATSITISEDNFPISPSVHPFRWRVIDRGSNDWPSNFIHFVDTVALAVPQVPKRYHRNLNGAFGDDVLLYGSGSQPDRVLYGSGDRGKGFVVETVTVFGTYDHVLKGDFNGDNIADLLFYGVGDAHDAIWYGTKTRGVFDKSHTVTVKGDYIPVVGNFDGKNGDDILWYGSGSMPDAIWYGSKTKGVFDKTRSVTVHGIGYIPITGDFDGDGRFDILWYRPGKAKDSLWYGTDTPGSFVTAAISVHGDYVPIVADFNGNGKDDILWYGRGSRRDTMWFGSGDRGLKFATGFTITVGGSTYKPIAGDFDGDGYGDVLWYRPGKNSDSIWYGTSEKGVFKTATFSIDGFYTPV